MWKSAVSGKFVIGGFVLGSWFVQKTIMKNELLKGDVFGYDGNGGRMLKIITDLTDEEMARLKYVRRLNWHWRGNRKLFDGRD